MEGNNKNRSVSEYLMCKKLRDALTTFPAFGAISKRFSSLNHRNSKTVAIDSGPPPSSPAGAVHVQTKPTATKPQNSSSQAIPINFDYTIPSSAPSRDHHASVTHVRVSETAEKKDMNSLFDDYIRRTRYKITTVSNVGRGHQGDTLADDEDNTSNQDNGSKKKDNPREHFSSFIHRSRRKIRTTSGIRRE